LRPGSGLAERYGLLAGRQLGVPVSEPGRDQVDRHEFDRSGADRRDADLTAAEQDGISARLGPPIGGLSTGRGLDRWPSLPDDADPLGGSQIPGNLVDALRRRAGTGSPLAEDLQRAGSEALGRDLSGVRIHADAEAGRLADSVQASAFTYGQDIYFAAGGYRPGEAAGRHLIAHELGHVGQDAGAGGVIGRADDPAEAGADRAAAGVLSALRRQAQNVSAVRRSPALATPSAAWPPTSVIRRGKRKRTKKGGKKAGKKAGKKGKVQASPLPVGQVAPPSVAPTDRSYQSSGRRLHQADDWWYKKGPAGDRYKWEPTPDLSSPVSTPRSTGASEPAERPAGSFTVERTWDKLSTGPGFIVQKITRTFAGIEVYDGVAWQPGTPARLQAWVDPALYPELYLNVPEYWEIFEVAADGEPLNDDTFELVAVADTASELANDWDNSSKGRYTQTGTAYFVPTGDSIATFAAHFGMTLGGAPPANGLWSLAGPCPFLAAASALYPVSQASTFTVQANWNTDTVTGTSQFVTLRISES
jgi:hypothetical protein